MPAACSALQLLLFAACIAHIATAAGGGSRLIRRSGAANGQEAIIIDGLALQKALHDETADDEGFVRSEDEAGVAPSLVHAAAVEGPVALINVSGTCGDRNLLTIKSKGMCELAACQLGLQNTTAEVIDLANVGRGETHGCYYALSADPDDTSSRLRWNPHDADVEEGASSERSVLCFKPLAHPLAIVDARTCEDHGMEPIHDRDDCEMAAAKLGLNDTDAVDVSRQPGDLPYGCFLERAPWAEARAALGPEVEQQEPEEGHSCQHAAALQEAALPILQAPHAWRCLRQ